MINKARTKARKAIEMLYEHMCTIVEYEKIKDPITKQTKFGENIVLENQPCKLSFSTTKASDQTESSNQVQQVIKLFIAPEVEIKEGSKIVVVHNNKSSMYKNSGVSSIFPTHQEIALELFKEWA
nr:MAG TPA: head closure knob [Caudoviricetes sp.]